MKKLLLVLFTLPTIIFISKGQTGYKTEVPDYLFATNVKSVLILQSQLNIMGRNIPNSDLRDGEIDVENLSSMSPELWKEVHRIVEGELSKLEIKPSLVYELDGALATKNMYGKTMVDMLKLYGEHLPYFTIRISFFDTKKLARKFKKNGSLELSDFGQMLLEISQNFGYQTADMPYSPGGLGGWVKTEELFPSFSTQIKKAQKSLKETVPESAINSYQTRLKKSLAQVQDLCDMFFMESEDKSTYPQDLMEHELLVIHSIPSGLSEDTRMGKYLNKQAETRLKVLDAGLSKLYKGDYKALYSLNYDKTLTQSVGVNKGEPYKYALVPITRYMVVGTQSTGSVRAERLEPRYSYKLKDLRTNEIYSGASPQPKLSANVPKRSVEEWAIRHRLNHLAKQLGWKKK